MALRAPSRKEVAKQLGGQQRARGHKVSAQPAKCRILHTGKSMQSALGKCRKPPELIPGNRTEFSGFETLFIGFGT